MGRTAFIQDHEIALFPYRHSDDADFYACWQDLDTQKGYNGMFNESFEDFETEDLSRFPFWSVIFDKKSQRTVGVLRLSPPPYDENDLAIWIYPPYRGQGFGTKAFVLGLRYCFLTLGLDTVGAGCYPNNNASQRMLKKIGFERVTEQDSVETDAFTGDPIVQMAYQIRKERFTRMHPI